MKLLKSVIFFFLFWCLLTLNQCQNNEKITLKSFKKHELEDLNFDLGIYDSLFITVEQRTNNTIVRVYYNGADKYIEPYWNGTFRVVNDSIYLGLEYIKSRDPFADTNIKSLGVGSVMDEYEFSKIDTSKYRFYSDWFVRVDERVYLGDEEEEEGKDE